MRKAASWFVAGLGFLIGLLALAFVGLGPIEFEDDLQRWIGFFGLALLALTFLVGSAVAVYSRRSASRIFLALIPMGALGLASQAWYVETGGFYEEDYPWRRLVLAAAMLVPIFAAFLAIGNSRQRTWWLFAATFTIALAFLTPSQWTFRWLVPLVGWSLFYIPFALFWWGTHLRQWPPLRSRPHSRLAVACLFCFAVVGLDVALTFVLSAMGSSVYGGDCRGTPIPVLPRPAGRAAFTARVLFTGISLSERMRSVNSFGYAREKTDPRVGNWAVAWVVEEFGGFLPWEPRLVLLTDFVYWKGETYFVDALRPYGMVRRLLPIFSGNLGCSRTAAAADAIVEMRVLRQPAIQGTRLIGSVRPPPIDSTFHSFLDEPPVPPQYSPGARIQVKGPNGTRIITTDQTGIYQIDGLPEGDYELTLLVPENQLVGFFDRVSTPARVKLQNGVPAGHNFQVYWNGRIEGRVTDRNSTPARVGVTLQKVDGPTLPSYTNSLLETDSDGRYRFVKIPAGRYRVIINDYGPNHDRPYDRQEYAQFIGLGEGQRIESIDFMAPPLAEHTVMVQVSTPDGLSREDVSVCAAYEHTQDFEALDGISCFGRTDAAGKASIPLHGASRVRLLATKTVFDPDNNSTNLVYRSQIIEAPADTIPSKVDLVLQRRTK